MGAVSLVSPQEVFVYGFFKAGYVTAGVALKKSGFKVYVSSEAGQSDLENYVSAGKTKTYSPREACKFLLMDLVVHNALQLRKGGALLPLYFIYSRVISQEKRFVPDVMRFSEKDLISSREIRTMYRLCSEYPDEEVRQVACMTFQFMHFNALSEFQQIDPPWFTEPGQWKVAWQTHRLRTKNKPLDAREIRPKWCEEIEQALKKAGE